MELIHEKFGTIRVEQASDGAPLFCAADVCRVLGYTNDTKAIKDHCRERGVTKRYLGVVTGKKSDGSDAIQQVQMTFIDEGNLYRLILRSNMPQARAFEDWVCDEVLPSLRRTGRYEMPRIYPVQTDEPPLKWVKGILAVRVMWLIEQGCLTDAAYRYLKRSGRLHIVQRACNNRPAMVAFDSLPTDIKQRASEAYSSYSPQITKIELKGIDLGDVPVRTINNVKQLNS